MKANASSSKGRRVSKSTVMRSLVLPIFVCCGLVVTLAAASYLDALDDTILHKINWAGPLPDELLDSSLESLDSIVMSTARNEKYKCMLPKRQEHSKSDEGPYVGLNPLELLSPLFAKFACSFKLETYWTYELCHGKYIRQYHEERDGKKVKLQEFFLGRWSKEDLEKTKDKVTQDFANTDYKTQLPTKKIDGVNMPYLQINMTDGTLCDLNGEPRATRVLYVCYPFGKDEIYSLEETSTCEYEIVVLSQNLCQHPDFKSRETGEKSISCHNLKDSPKMPTALVELEAESFKIRHENLFQNLETLLETKMKGDVRPVDVFTEDSEEALLKPFGANKPSLHDHSFLVSFLSGKSCLTGGSNWWKFELCFGKHVLQFHEEPNSPSRTEIILGKWNVEQHKKFLDANPFKKATTLPSKKQVVHFYGGGAKCDATGQPRSVEVKFRCLDNPSPSATAIALYLLEPKTCEYTLTVESSLLCSALQNSDDYNLFEASDFFEDNSFGDKSTGGFKDRPRKPVTSSPSLSKEKDSRSATTAQERERSFNNRMKERKGTPPPNDMEIVVLDGDDDQGVA